MPRRHGFDWTSLPPGMDLPRLLRELNGRFGRLKRALEDYPEPFVLTYGASVAVDALAAEWYRLTVTTVAAFTIQFPTNLAPGQPVAFEIINGSGGVMGAVTWAVGYSLAGAFVAPANGFRRVYGFRAVSVTSLIEMHRSPADI
jgi:hypothetical protein